MATPESTEKAQRVPRYAQPNISSRLPATIGSEHEMIRAAFAPGSYTSIGGLGKAAGQPDDSLSASSMSTSDALSFKAGGQKPFFAEFEYSVSPYDLAAEVRSRERKDHLSKVNAIANGQPFVAPGVVSQMKHENTYPYETDPFDTVKGEVLRGKWLSERKVLAGAFLPPGRDKCLEKPTRALLTDIMAQLHKTLYEDWEELLPTVFNTAEDLIVVYFNITSIKPHHRHGLLAYMNVLAKRGSVVVRHDLRQVKEGWNVSTEEKHTMFAFRPPWVKEKKFTSFENTSPPPPPGAA